MGQIGTEYFDTDLVLYFFYYKQLYVAAVSSVFRISLTACQSSPLPSPSPAAQPTITLMVRRAYAVPCRVSCPAQP
jgi:hypothetical protein